ncbi:MAG: leucyl/phenylalanyl-tRNA--protein transferase, partial [Bdellovibrionales bacterium]|nr:leucyl/phenylalanyl-tRNA--protein transferase [Bdellovibrionales bacterium]
MSDENDIVAVGLDLSPKTLLAAYSEGVFPWPTEGLPLLWYFPKKRGILDFKDLHIPRRLHSFLKNRGWSYRVDEAFSEVIDACADRGKNGTWITAEMKAAYCELHRLGHAHSIEVWKGDSLIGGIYGVDTGGYFAGESMFHRETNASKAAWIAAVAIQKMAGRTWMDIQVVSPHTASFGAMEVSRTEFKKRMAETKS